MHCSPRCLMHQCTGGGEDALTAGTGARMYLSNCLRASPTMPALDGPPG